MLSLLKLKSTSINTNCDINHSVRRLGTSNHNIFITAVTSYNSSMKVNVVLAVRFGPGAAYYLNGQASWTSWHKTTQISM